MQIRDPIHGFIEYDETEEKLINSLAFQRLRGIKQLAMANLVYPSANHTRFEHCIGTMHLAGKIAEKFFPKKNEYKKRKIIRLAGLLHDIGHGPFSHVSENVLLKKLGKKTLDDYKADGCHELMSIFLIRYNEEIGKILSDAGIDKNEIIEILQKQEGRNIDKDIVSGPLDADKIDYLLRDSHFAGVKYGVFDIDKLMESLEPIKISSKNIQVGIKEEGVYTLEQMLLAKYHMSEQVYFHKIRRITDAMIVRGIEFALEEGIKKIKDLYNFQSKPSFLNNYICHDDKTVMDIILSKSKSVAKDFFMRLKERRLFKKAFSVDIDKSPFDSTIQKNNVKNLSYIQREKIEKNVAELFSIAPSLVIVDRQSSDNPTFRSPEKDINFKEIMVNRETDNPELFSEVSKIFGNRVIDPKKEMLYIYLPWDCGSSKIERDNIFKKNENKIMNIIKEEVKNESESR
jgi:uncharacterized protein